ncbi:tyrosine-type recombinase/integrase [Neoaquamicrobium sediminum]|uniref:tyrosine-type recombinase/integrase n=1 Tax=Neoaquamicrobium sediminum TaxID=1849104 RepID=UPI003619EE25
MRAINKLTARGIDAISKPGLYADGLGLYLQVSPSGTKSWIFRFMQNGRSRKMGLGPVAVLSLKQAREQAQECQSHLLVGRDPIEVRNEQRRQTQLQQAKALTFKEASNLYIAAHRAGWKNLKHAAQWKATLETYAYPVFGDWLVSSVDVGAVLRVLEPIWTEKPETASRVRGRIESVLDWATARGYRLGDNPARWRGHLDKLLPARSKVQQVKHHAALAYPELPEFMIKLRAVDGVAARALEFAILTAGRTGEIIGARWKEIDRDNAMWTIPGERMKARREHRVPLAPAAVSLLDALPVEKGSDFVFIGSKERSGLSNMALLMTLRRMKREDLTVHGFRSTFRDWAAETTAYPHELLEMALAHVVSDQTVAAYLRGDMLEKRRRLMADWADYCASTPRGDVVPIRGVV